MEWRPIVSGQDNRYLTMFIDLQPGRSDSVNAGELPNYALLQKLTSSNLAAGNVHYIYFIHPETPAAVPLLRDEANHHDGFEVRFHAELNGADPSLQYDLRLYHMELS